MTGPGERSARIAAAAGSPSWRAAARTLVSRLPRVSREPARVEPTAQTIAVSYVLSMLSAALLVLVLTVTLISQVQHFTSQTALYEQARLELAEGSIPISQTDINGQLVAPGSPVAILQIPSLGIREVIVEGTTSSQTKTGIGHRRDTPLPGQPGGTVLMGRAAAWGGVFAHIDELPAGATITVTTGQGIASYRVLGVRTPTTALPVLTGTDSRMTLTTASGLPFIPSGILRVDAVLTSTPFAKPPVAVRPGVVPADEEAFAVDTSGVFALSWLLELLLILVIVSTWVWNRWPRRVAWLLIVPPVACVALAVAGNIGSLLPNLL